MLSRSFVVRAAGVFITTAVVFAAMIVIANGLKMPGETSPFLPVADRDVGNAAPMEASSPGDDRQRLLNASTAGRAADSDRSTLTAQAEPVPVITARPVPIDGDAPDNEAAGDTVGTTSTTTRAAGTAETAQDGKPKHPSVPDKTDKPDPPDKPGTQAVASTSEPMTTPPTPAPTPTPTPTPTPSESATASAEASEEPTEQ